MRFFLNNEEVRLVVAPQVSFTQNETPDTFNCSLAANNREQTYKPMTPFVIEWDDGEKSLFYIVLDNVEVFSANPKTYTHKLTLVQNNQALEKHIIRTTNFTQPANREKTTYYSRSFRWVEATDDFHPYIVPLSGSVSINNVWSEQIVIDPKEKIENIQYKVNVFSVRNTIDKTNSHVIENNNVLRDEKGQVLSDFFSSIGVSIRTDKSVQPAVFSIDARQIVGEWIDAPSNALETLKLDEGSKIIASASFIGYSFSANGGYAIDDINHLIIQLEVRFKTYYYTAYDVLETLAKQYAKKRSYTDFEPVYVMPDKNSEFGKLLSSTIVPNMFFSQTTLFQAVLNVFQLYDAVFTIDENKVLGIEYLNDNSKEKIEDIKASGVRREHKEGTFNNKFICSYQNALQDVKHPTTSFALSNSNGLGVPQESDHLIKLPYAIESLTKVELFMEGRFSISGIVPQIGTEARTTTVNCEGFSLDITSFIKDDTSWSLLDKDTIYPADVSLDIGGSTFSVRSYQYLTQISSLPYSKGSREINLATKYNNNISQTLYTLGNVVAGAIYRFMGKGYRSGSVTEIPAYPNANTNAIAWDSILYRVSYKANTNGILSIEGQDNKYSGEYLTNQQGNNVDIAKLGANILGLQIRSGVPTLVITHEITTLSQAIKKGQIWERDDGRWIATVCSYTIYNNKVVGTIEFSKNYNAISLSTQINNQKRFSNISNELVSVCKDWINEYCYISTQEIESGNTIIAFNDIMPFVARTFGDLLYDQKVDMACFKVLDSYIYIPLRTYHSANNLCFEMEFSSPISAGYRLTRENGAYFNETVNYTDENGFFDKCDITFWKKNEEFSVDFPVIDTSEQTLLASISDFEYCKKPNEIFGLAYSLTFLSYGENEIFIGKKFLENNGFYNDRNKDILYLVETDYDFSIFDEVIKDYTQRRLVEGVVVEGNKISFITQQDTEFARWAIVDSEGNIYLSSNEKIEHTRSFELYFTTRTKRL